MLAVTCLAILAVDFPVFPRRYAKVETWGTSLMDLGVGSFVFSAGVVSARAVVSSSNMATSIHTSNQEPSTSSKSESTFSARFLKALRHSLPLFLLGFIRLYSVKGLDYAEHVTEYGVHWNFFFTLALLPPFAEISDTLTSFTHHLPLIRSYEILAVSLAVVYEVVLNNTSLLSYILISPRGPDLLSKNREGVFSFIGYLAIFLAGRGIGVPLVKYNEDAISSGKAHLTETPTTQTHRERRFLLKTLLTGAIGYITIYTLSTSLYTFNLTVSRRLANLPYVLWVIAFNTAQLLLFAVIESLGPEFSHAPTQEDKDKERVRTATSRILRVFNNNGLIVFLVANLLTGVVNLSVNTLDMPPMQAMGMLICYAVAVTAVALGLDRSGLKIKL